jgi:hypothetical protein
MFSFKHAFEFISDPDALQLPDGKKLTVNRSFLKIDLEKLIALAVQGLHLFISYFSPGSNIECY